MKEKRLKRFLSSIRGHIESGHSEVVEEKKNIDTSLEKILKWTNAEERDTGSLGHSNEASELHSLIHDLHRHYQSLYGHYDHFIGKLKKKVHHDGESNGSFLSNSSSSDSESSDSESNEFYKHNEKANKTEEEKIAVEDNQNLKSQLENLKTRNAELENEAISMVSKIKEGETLATKLAERETAYLAMEGEFNNMRGRNEILQIENEDLKREFSQQQFLTSQRLQSFEEEKEALLLEKSMSLNRLEQTDKHVEEFKVRVKQLEDEISELQNENGFLKGGLKISEVELSNVKERIEGLQIENGDLKEELEKSNQLQALFNERNEALLLEKSTILKKLEEVDGYLERSKIEAEELKEEKEALLLEKSMSLNRLEQTDKHVEEFKVRVKQLEDEISELQNENGCLKGGLKISEVELSNVEERIEGLQIENGDLKEELEKSNQLQALFNERNEALLLEKSTILKKLEEADGYLERSKIEAEELKEEKETLLLEKSMSLNRLEQTDKHVEEFKVRVKQLEDEISELQNENGFLMGGLKISEVELSNVKERIEGLQIENGDLKEELERSNQLQALFNGRNEALLLEKSTILKKLEEADGYLERSKIEDEELKHEISKLQDENGVLKKELEAKIQEVDDLNQKQALVSEEKNALSLETFTLLGKIQLADETTRDLREQSDMNWKLANERLSENEKLLSENEKLRLGLEGAHQQRADLTQRSEIEAEQLKHEISELQDENGVLKHELEAKIQELDELNQKLVSASEEKNASSLENFTLLGKIQLADETTRHFRDESDLNLKLANERLSENENLLSENEKLKLELEGAHRQIADLIQSVSNFEEDTSTLKSEMLEITSKMQVSEKIIEELRHERGQSKDEKSRLLGINEDLNLQLRVKDDEKASLDLEHSEVVTKLRQIQANLELLSEELQRLNVEKSDLQVKYEGLGLELESANCEVSDLRRKLQISQEEKSAISAECSVLLDKTQEFEKMMDDLKTEKEQLESDNSLLKSKTDDLVCELESVEESKDTLESEKLVALKKLEQTESSLKEILKEVEQLRRESSVFQQDQLDSQHKISDLGRSLEDKEANISSLQKNLEEASSQIQTMAVNAGNLQQELDLACIKMNELEEQVKTVTDFVSEKQIVMDRLEEDLRNEILTKEMMLKDQKSNLDELLTNYRLLESQLEESAKKLEIAEGKMAEMESKDETIKLLQKVDQEQKVEISRLVENLKELSEKLKFSESEKAELDKEILKLYGQVQTIEVQIRLSNQKLKITETENKEKEENHKKTMEALQAEHRKLEEHTSTLQFKTRLMEDNIRQVKEVVKVEMESLDRAFDLLESKLEGNCRHMQAQVSWCSDDVVMLKQWIRALMYAREGLKNEKRDLTMRLNYKEGIISMLKDEAGVLGSKLAAKVKEEERLVLKVTELGKSMQVLEKRVKEKEEELFSKDEEKKEAIRQLCLLIEYHRENCDHLFKFLSATLKRSKRTA